MLNKIKYAVILSAPEFDEVQSHFFKLGGFYNTGLPFLEVWKNQSITNPKPNRLSLLALNSVYEYSKDKFFFVVYDDNSAMLSQTDPGGTIIKPDTFFAKSDLLAEVRQHKPEPEEKTDTDKYIKIVEDFSAQFKDVVIVLRRPDDQVILKVKGENDATLVNTMASAVRGNKFFRDLLVDSGKCAALDHLTDLIKGK